MQVDFVRGDNWIGVYVDEQLIFQGHTIDPKELLDLLLEQGLETDIECRNLYPDEEWLEGVSSFPYDLSDIDLNIDIFDE